MFGIKLFLENVTDSKVMKHAGWLQAADAPMSQPCTQVLHSGAASSLPWSPTEAGKESFRLMS